LLDADADRADLELRLIKLLLKDRAPVHPFAGNGRFRRNSDIAVLVFGTLSASPIATMLAAGDGRRRNQRICYTIANARLAESDGSDSRDGLPQFTTNSSNPKTLFIGANRPASLDQFAAPALSSVIRRLAPWNKAVAGSVSSSGH
jgi:hypothetical protein